jgi:hypothetical protein
MENSRSRNQLFIRNRNQVETQLMVQIYTIIHTVISLIAIFTGLVVLFGMIGCMRLDRRG